MIPDNLNPKAGSSVPRCGGWIQVFTGGQFWPLDPRPEEIDIRDIAHALAMQCRFIGHCQQFYSVAEHSVRVSRICDPADALWGLLHDASEAYICDLSRPLKKHSRLGDEYERIEATLMEEIALRFDLPVNQPDSVSLADNRMLAVEARDLMSPLQPGWELSLLDGTEPTILATWDPPQAERQFIHRFVELDELRRPADAR